MKGKEEPNKKRGKKRALLYEDTSLRCTSSIEAQGCTGHAQSSGRTAMQYRARASARKGDSGMRNP